ncbi:hypothetical protein P154DRAFT_614461 [Amniculicola lignicola CBS 123094]|uniref:Uncharacterized protein n=1 Tax=Amniculicola lignicola CBS 123094 TaxID=1392246 RepID=A0A6A5X5E1_9PLEO|nr:hypothetical protein P154DRAFT_614461 [Amniculicola lignicola CBS 123094]
MDFFQEKKELEMIQRKFATFSALINAIYDEDTSDMGSAKSTVSQQAALAHESRVKEATLIPQHTAPEAPKDWYIPLARGTLCKDSALDQYGRPKIQHPASNYEMATNSFHPLPAGTFGAVALLGPHQTFRLQPFYGVPPSHPFFNSVKDPDSDYLLPTTHLMNLAKAMEESWGINVMANIEPSTLLSLAKLGTFQIYLGNHFMQVPWLPHYVKRKLQRCGWYCQSILQGQLEDDTQERKQACYVFLWTCSAIIHEVNKLMALRSYMPKLCGALVIRSATLPQSKEHQMAQEQIGKVIGMVNMYERQYVNTMIQAMMAAKEAGGDPMKALLNPNLMMTMQASIQFQSMVTISTGAGVRSAARGTYGDGTYSSRYDDFYYNFATKIFHDPCECRLIEFEHPDDPACTSIQDVGIRLAYLVILNTALHIPWLRYWSPYAPYTTFINNKELTTLVLVVQVLIYTYARMASHVSYVIDDSVEGCISLKMEENHVPAQRQNAFEGLWRRPTSSSTIFILHQKDKDIDSMIEDLPAYHTLEKAQSVGYSCSFGRC